MKKLIIISVLFFICVNSFATKYYVDYTSGNNSNDGSIGSPWKTWNYAMDVASLNAGDTVYFRGGVYIPEDLDGGYGIDCERNGSEGNYINFWAYPGETPILDCRDVTPAITGNYPLSMGPMTYIHFKGLTIRNAFQKKATDEVNAWRITSSENVIVENCVIHDVHGGAFCNYSNNVNLYYINCDAYNCCDSLTTLKPGNDGTGFLAINSTSTTDTSYYINNRAWNCGDQGFSGGSSGS